jgi:hypothetical protein
LVRKQRKIGDEEDRMRRISVVVDEEAGEGEGLGRPGRPGRMTGWGGRFN